VLYVWIDALSNYITALGYASNNDELFKKYWPANVHLIGKEILWFHTVYWPAILFSLGFALPKQVFAHGWWTSEGRKMGKSLGNFIDLEKLRSLVSTYSLDALRFYLLRAAPFGSDLDFSQGDFNKSFNELANVLGNLLNRTINMVKKYRGTVPPGAATEDIDRNLVAATEALPAQIKQAYEKLELQQAVLLPIELARTANGYIDATRPFSLAKDPSQAARLDTVLNLAVQATKNALVALLPVLPTKARDGLNQLGIDPQGKSLGQLFSAQLPPGGSLGDATPLFPKVEMKS
jgi:methionyl-tRNA synthetase